MAKRVLDYSSSGVAPMTGGAGSAKIAPGRYQFQVTKAEDKPAGTGTPMLTCSFKVLGRGPDAGKTVIDRFTFPRKRGDSTVGVARLGGLLEACGVRITGRKVNLDLEAGLPGKRFWAEAFDSQEEASADGRYAARIVTKLAYTGDEDDVNDDDEDEDEDLDEDEEGEDDLDEDLDEDEEEEPAPARRRTATATATRTRSNGRQAAPAAAPARRNTRRQADDAEDDFPF